MDTDLTMPPPPAQAAAPAPSSTDQRLDQLIALMTANVAPAAPAAAVYAGPRGAASMAASLPQAPPPAPPAVAATPHPGETFVPGEIGYFRYHDYRDAEGKTRVQVVSVAHTDDDHVHAIVLGDARNLASFQHGVLTHAYPEGD
jgi:hypothetical protein